MGIDTLIREDKNYIFVSMCFTHRFYSLVTFTAKKIIFKSRMKNWYCQTLIRIKKKLLFKSIWANHKYGFKRTLDLNQFLHLIRITWGCDLNHVCFVIQIKWSRGNPNFSHNFWFKSCFTLDSNLATKNPNLRVLTCDSSNICWNDKVATC